MVIIAGVLDIVCSLFYLFTFILINMFIVYKGVIGGPMPEEFRSFDINQPIFGILISLALMSLISSVITFIGGIFTLKKRRWELALVGSIFTLFPTINPMGILAIIFTVKSKTQFK